MIRFVIACIAHRFLYTGGTVGDTFERTHILFASYSYFHNLSCLSYFDISSKPIGVWAIKKAGMTVTIKLAFIVFYEPKSFPQGFEIPNKNK